jgi:hypothetical protein
VAHWRWSDQKPFIESFNGKLRYELLNAELFDTLLEAKVLAEDLRVDYNEFRPRSSLGQLTPSEFAEEWPQDQARLSEGVDLTIGGRSLDSGTRDCRSGVRT